MNVKNLLCLASAVALTMSATAYSQQSLPELARAEKARRAKLQKAQGPAKVYTEGDRRAGDDLSQPEGAAAPTAGAATPATGKKEKTPEEVAADRQKEWSERVKQVQDQIKDLQDAISKNERVMGSLINITPQRADLANQIEADKKKVADLQQSLVNLEDERRRAGMPRPR